MIEIIAFRVGTARLKKLGIHHGMLRPLRPFRLNPHYRVNMYISYSSPCLGIDPHGHHVGSYAAHGPEADSEQDPTSGNSSDLEKVTKVSDVGHAHHHVDTRKEKSFQNDVDAMAQLIGVAILEFGVVLHRHVFLVFLSYITAPDNRVCFF